jgi:uncharacterized RDD family membrane protein YckC
MVTLRLPKQRTIQVPASLFKRFLAMIIDLFIINLVIVTPFRGNLIAKIPTTEFTESLKYLTENPGITNSLYSMMIAIFFMIFLYFVIFDVKLGQTPGKMLLKIYSISEIPKQPLGLWNSLLRNLGILLIPLFFPIIFIDIGIAFFNKDKKRGFEILSHSKTIENIGV